MLRRRIRRRTARTFEDRLREHRAHLETQLEATSDAEEKARLESLIFDVDTALDMDQWLRAPQAGAANVKDES